MPLDIKGYKILIVEDNPGDFTLVEDFLFERIQSPAIIRAESFKETKEILLKDNKFDFILLDLSLPDKQGEELIMEMVADCSNTPIIVLTGYADFAFSVRSLSLGIADYILKEELTSISLYKSIVYSVERKKAMATLELSEKQYNELFHLSPLPMFVFDIDTLQFLDVNVAAIKNYEYGHAEFLSMTVKDIKPIDDMPEFEENLKKYGTVPHVMSQDIFKHQKKNGEIIQVDIQSNPILYKGNKAKVMVTTDITERLNYIKSIEAQNDKLKEIAWMQSHVIRAPLARIMGLIHIMDIEEDACEKEKILSYILLSANELDDVIRNISDKTDIVHY